MTYRRIASLEEYVVLAQDDHQVTVHRRTEKGRPQSYFGPQGQRGVSLDRALGAAGTNL